jgi:hypothetical protein
MEETLASKTITIDGTFLKLEVWNPGGSQNFKSPAAVDYRNTRVAIVVLTP